jgi:Rrf2 family protein
MRLGEGVEWAVHCATLLAALPDRVCLPARRLAEFHGVPGPYLAKSLQALTAAGLLESRGGRHGGYRLSRPAGRITLLEVVLAVEGNETFFRCTEIRRRGPSAVAGRAYSPRCGVAGAMWRAEQAWRDELSRVTLAELAGIAGRDTPPAAQAKAIAWYTEVLAGR